MSWVALSPSLIPRTWWMTATNVAQAQLLGFAVGSALGAAGRAVARATEFNVSVSPQVARGLASAWDGTVLTLTTLAWLRSVDHQREIARLVHVEPRPAHEQALGMAAGTAAFGATVLQVRGVALTAQGFSYVLRDRLPRQAVPVASTALTGLLAYGLYRRVVIQRLLDLAVDKAAEANAILLPGRRRPREAERSGSAQSTEPFWSLGSHGQAVVSDGPRARHIARATRAPSREPIRAYAGKRADRDLEATAQAVMDELHRTRAFERKVLAVMTGTGTGWVQEWSLASIEFLTQGDCASAAMQYTHLPSGLAYWMDRKATRQAGKVLFDAVYAHWKTLPENERPMLVTGGESLGSYGGQAAFTSIDDMLSKVEGAVWAGTPRFTPIWQELVAKRRKGSPEIAPVIDNGRHVRFMTEPKNLHRDYYGAPYEKWRFPRVVYAQHASDPIVWWDLRLLWQEPDWLRERAGRDVIPSMRWWPWVTFWQVSTDMPASTTVPDGHGHSYGKVLLNAWAAVLGIPKDRDLSPVENAIRRLLLPR